MSHLSEEHLESLYSEFGELKVLDDIIKHRAADDPPAPILAYPRTDSSIADFEYFTGRDLDRLIDGAVMQMIRLGLEPNGRKTVGILAPSNVDFIVSFFALSRLSYTVLALSLRIAPGAVANLLKQTECVQVVHGHTPQILSTVQAAQDMFPVALLPIPIRRQYDQSLTNEPPFVREYNREEENSRIAVIMHSSGSTGLPRPVMLTHRAILTHPMQGSGYHNFNALPWYHLYGVSTSLQAMWMRKTAHLYNAALPITSDSLVEILDTVKPEAVHTVPYVLGLMAETQRGVELLKRCKIVTGAGARTPDELGDRLVREGVNLGIVFGTTEAGLVGDTMRRAEGDDSWNFIRIYANIRKHVYMNPLGDGLYECVYLKDHPALSTSNSDFPAPSSWHSRDAFTPHPSMPDVWKYVTRIDDRITLANGEKVLPLPIEGRIRENSLVREAVVVGVDQTIPGVLIFRAVPGDHLSDETYLDAIWPSITDANSRAERFSQITRDMICLIPSNVEYPQTDKRSPIRSQVYSKFANEIEEMYVKLMDGHEGLLQLNLSEIEDYLLVNFKDATNIPLESVETDFFTAGVDSLKAIQMRRIIQKTLQLNGHQLPRNIIYSTGNIKRLARYLHTLATSEEVEDADESGLMQELIDRYSGFHAHKSLNGSVNRLGFESKAGGNSVILTGATGSVGAHLLHKLITLDSVDTIYCFCRDKNPILRVLRALNARGLNAPNGRCFAKIMALTTSPDQIDFGLDKDTIKKLRGEVSLIIHAAWPVNFTIPLQNFEPHITGLHNLLQFSLSVHRPEPAQVFFCSSVSVAFNAHEPAAIPEGPIEEFGHASKVGYAQSKLVGEHIVRCAARMGARSYVLRIGQVVGDTVQGVWNDNESIPLMIRSALLLKALPELDESCSWIPVDTLAATILDLSQTVSTTSARPSRHHNPEAPDALIFYNLVNPTEFTWTNLLSELRAAGLEFDVVPFQRWLDLLRESAANGEEKRNPAIKLIDYYEMIYGAGQGSRVRFDTAAARRDAGALSEAVDVVSSGLLRRFLDVWMRRWE